MNSKGLLVYTGLIFSATVFVYQIISPIAEEKLNAEIPPPPKEVAELIPVSPADIEPTPVVATPKPTVSAPAPTSAPDTTTLGTYTMSQVALHSTAPDCWSVVNGLVYNLTSYVNKHPGGAKEIIRICGRDGSSSFEGQHGGESKPERILASYQIGTLK